MSLRRQLSKMNLEELRDLNHLCIAEINRRLQEEGQEVAKALRLGDRVYFDHAGQQVYGRLRKLGIKNARVEIEEERDDGRIEVKLWQVPTALLHKAEKKSRKLHHKKVPSKKHHQKRPDYDEGEL